MSEILTKAKAHFEGLRQLRTLHVPEWDETIYYYPVMSIGEKREIGKLYMEGDLEAIVKAVILRVRDADGNRIFRAVDRLELLQKVDSEVLERIVQQMGEPASTVEDTEKK